MSDAASVMPMALEADQNRRTTDVVERER